MSDDKLIVLVVALVAAIAFATDRIRSEVVALGVLCALAAGGVLAPAAALSGFASPAVATVAAMFVLGAALAHGGALAGVERLLKLLPTRTLMRLVLLPFVALLSAFVNNTAVVAVTLPSVMRTLAERGWSPSKFLIPLSYATQFGGVCTLIGTSTNLLVNSIAIEAGLPGFSMFEFTALGVCMFLAGTIYLLTIGVRLLPDRGGGQPAELFALDDYVAEVAVRDPALAGKRLEELKLHERHGLQPLDLIRGSRRFWRPRAVLLEAGDIIRVSGAVDDLTSLPRESGLELHAERFFGTAIASDEGRRLLEVLIPPGSQLIGRTVGELQLAERWNAALLAVRRHGEPQRQKISNLRLAAGDILLLMVTDEGAQAVLESADLVPLNARAHTTPHRGGAWLPLLAVVAAVALAALGWLPIWLGALSACFVLLLTRALTSEEAVEAIDWRVLVLIAGMLPLGLAMQKTGLAADMVRWLFATLGSDSPQAALVVIYAVTAILTEIMSNNAAAVLVVPIGISIADHLGVEAHPFLVAIAFAASTSFATPVGYQTNTMVYNAGNYRFADFVRVGLPLNVLFVLLASWLIPVFFPFTPR